MLRQSIALATPFDGRSNSPGALGRGFALAFPLKETFT